jgi:hypothetical protein
MKFGKFLPPKRYDEATLADVEAFPPMGRKENGKS